jgi:two-component system cell cycle response regulator CtrA
MKVLAVGLDETTLAFLRAQGVAAEANVDIDEAEELGDWLRDGNFNVGIIHLEASKLGIYTCRAIRNKGISIPIVGISDGSETHRWSDFRALFLENGGDDLLRGPANPRELAASIRAVTRRFTGGLVDMLECNNGQAQMKINLTTGFISINGERVYLTHKELSTLIVLAEAPGRVLSKESILTGIYFEGVDDEPDIKIIDVFICKLRKKLTEIHPDAEGFVETVWGRGYMLVGHVAGSTNRQVA